MLRTFVTKFPEALSVFPRALLSTPKAQAFCESALSAFGQRSVEKINPKISVNELDYYSFPPTSGELLGCGWRDPDHIKILLGKDYDLFAQYSNSKD